MNNFHLWQMMVMLVAKYMVLMTTVHAVVVCIWKPKDKEKKKTFKSIFFALQCDIIKSNYVINHRRRSHCGKSIQEGRYQYHFSKDNSNSWLKQHMELLLFVTYWRRGYNTRGYRT